MRDSLQKIFDERDWSGRGKAPRSGPGSTLEATARIRSALPRIFKDYDIRRVVDAPCGDWTWMQAVDLSEVSYLGCDIAPSIVELNARQHSRENVAFDVLDITSSPLPPSDLFLCRECLFHLKWWLRWAIFENFAACEGQYLMTTIDHIQINRRLSKNGGFCRFDPRLPPFNFPEPLEIIPENYDIFPAQDASNPDRSSKYRSMGIWSIDQVRHAVAARAWYLRKKQVQATKSE